MNPSDLHPRGTSRLLRDLDRTPQVSADALRLLDRAMSPQCECDGCGAAVTRDDCVMDGDGRVFCSRECCR